MTFAALQQRVNAVASARLGDATTLNGVAVAGRFMDEAAQAFNGVYGDKPVFEMDGVDTAADHRGKTLIVNATSYTVRESRPNLRNRSTLLTLEEA